MKNFSKAIAILVLIASLSALAACGKEPDPIISEEEYIFVGEDDNQTVTVSDGYLTYGWNIGERTSSKPIASSAVGAESSSVNTEVKSEMKSISGLDFTFDRNVSAMFKDNIKERSSEEYTTGIKAIGYYKIQDGKTEAIYYDFNNCRKYYGQDEHMFDCLMYADGYREFTTTTNDAIVSTLTKNKVFEWKSDESTTLYLGSSIAKLAIEYEDGTTFLRVWTGKNLSNLLPAGFSKVRSKLIA